MNLYVYLQTNKIPWHICEMKGRWWSGEWYFAGEATKTFIPFQLPSFSWKMICLIPHWHLLQIFKNNYSLHQCQFLWHYHWKLFHLLSIFAGLTLYDMKRDPRPPVSDESSTTIPIRTLNKVYSIILIIWGYE